MKIGLGTTSPVSYQATLKAFQTVYADVSLEITCFDHVLHPIDGNTASGAIEMAKMAQNRVTADFGVGVVEGREQTPQGLFFRAWGSISNKNGQIGVASSVSVLIPERIHKIMQEQNCSFNEGVSLLFRTQKKDDNTDFVRFISKNHLSCVKLYTDMIIAALIPLYHLEIFITKKLIYCEASSHEGEGVTRFTRIREILQNFGHTVLTNEPSSTLPSSDTTAHDSAEGQSSKTALIERCDLMIIEVTEPKLQTGFEIAYALNRHKPVIALFFRGDASAPPPIFSFPKNRLMRVYAYELSTLEGLLKRLIN